MNNCGFSESEAKQIEHNFHEAYKVSKQWIETKINEILTTGYATGAFGLRVRCPVLAYSLLNSKKTPYKALAEARTAGNMLSGQSYCMLNNRAVNEFMDRVYKSEYRNDIKPVCLIHDASYYLVRNNVNVIKWVNDNLIDCMAWQELDEIKHDKVKMEAELDIYYPTWADAITLPNNISKEQIKQIAKNHHKR